ncbi:hypothetical protein N7474_008647 [Penicillium riverlandense]|uniref:uncharacterized protein n=1 Tax=Penicillium riverlandense TaxID=1903569 RepID=UPI0025478A24|nr:uncharacterized protein N7474_008647 [Penicillium riverlandense]KAJ5812346.1 hypothetical protein N7474_008647 [Penicillium riverlandense]
MSRPQVSIDRLTPRRVTVEPREAMNCKSCRKRKVGRICPDRESPLIPSPRSNVIACDQAVRPARYSSARVSTVSSPVVLSCGFLPILIPPTPDAVPKKRGPKTDVLEALLKRVDGLEKRLQDEKNPISPTSPDAKDEPPPHASGPGPSIDTSVQFYPHGDSRPTLPTPLTHHPEPFARPSAHRSSSFHQQPSPQLGILSDAILDTYFARLHGKPFHILDESTTRKRYQLGQLPPYLSTAIAAMTLRYTSSAGQSEQSLNASLDAALQARRAVDVDNPTLDGLQALLLLSQVFFAHGLGKKAYMTFSNCVAMIVALDLFREVPTKANLSPAERETRRRLFWAVYLMDRFITCGSRRPSLISDHSIVLRLPSWSPHATGLNMEGELFHVGPNIQYSADSRRKSPSAASLLIDITRILGVTNRYLAAGGVKGDSHFPWHALSTLSKIRQELDIWAAGTQDVFASIDVLFGHPESTTLLLSKLIYHLVHCLIYRPFLPIDLVELRGTGQHQSWQIEATNLCFSHSNAIAELVELGRNSSLVEWPSFVGYCICTAGTVHVHGVHYKGREGEVFSSSGEFLTREMHQLTWLRNSWAGVQHQRELLQTIYTCHAELVRTLASSPMRFSPVFHLEDFLDRYPGLAVDGAHVRLVDMGDESATSATNLVDRQDHYYQRQMNAPSYQSPSSFYSTTRSGHTSQLPSAQTLDSDRRNSHSHSLTNKPAHTTALSPTFHFHPPPNNPHQPSPTLPSIFPMSGTDLSQGSGNPSGSADNTHLSLPNGFSPSAFGLSPPAFLSDTSLNIAPTPPPNPQYAIFPFDTPHANMGGAQNAAGGATAATPGGQSQTSGSHTGGSETGSLEKDPFLSLLEQLAENEHSQGGPSELDFFLTGTGAVDGEGGPPGEDKVGGTT